MFGQWALGSSPIGEPEEIAAGTPAPTDCCVWITASESTEVLIVAPAVNEEQF